MVAPWRKGMAGQKYNLAFCTETFLWFYQRVFPCRTPGTGFYLLESLHFGKMVLGF